MSDIVERLRNLASELAREAADTIVRLGAEYEQLSERWKLLQEEIGRLRTRNTELELLLTDPSLKAIRKLRAERDAARSLVEKLLKDFDHSIHDVEWKWDEKQGLVAMSWHQGESQRPRLQHKRRVLKHLELVMKKEVNRSRERKRK